MRKRRASGVTRRLLLEQNVGYTPGATPSEETEQFVQLLRQ